MRTPPGRYDVENVEDRACEVCGLDPFNCICPECPVCGTTGDPLCYTEHGLTRNDIDDEASEMRSIASIKWQTRKNPGIKVVISDRHTGFMSRVSDPSKDVAARAICIFRDLADLNIPDLSSCTSEDRTFYDELANALEAASCYMDQKKNRS